MHGLARVCNAGIPDWFQSSIAKVLKFLAEYAVSLSNTSLRRSTSKYRRFSGFTAATSLRAPIDPPWELEASLLGWMSCDRGFFWVGHSPKIRCSQNEPLLAIVRKTLTAERPFCSRAASVTGSRHFPILRQRGSNP
ncbi:hypothetical protein [Microcoleus sp. SVA1_A1]|uniref:hypothetical protein n=1 Tax=Microcoleus sp. SVA1_A1 TaxID=2818946 RepID=UPI002FD52689